MRICFSLDELWRLLNFMYSSYLAKKWTWSRPQGKFIYIFCIAYCIASIATYTVIILSNYCSKPSWLDTAFPKYSYSTITGKCSYSCLCIYKIYFGSYECWGLFWGNYNLWYIRMHVIFCKTYFAKRSLVNLSLRVRKKRTWGLLHC